MAVVFLVGVLSGKDYQRQGPKYPLISGRSGDPSTNHLGLSLKLQAGYLTHCAERFMVFSAQCNRLSKWHALRFTCCFPRWCSPQSVTTTVPKIKCNLHPSELHVGLHRRIWQLSVCLKQITSGAHAPEQCVVFLSETHLVG